MTKLELILIGIVLFSGTGTSSPQSLRDLADVSKSNCEAGLRAKGCSRITSSCQFQGNSFKCQCEAGYCPPGSGGGQVLQPGVPQPGYDPLPSYPIIPNPPSYTPPPTGSIYNHVQLDRINNLQEFRTNGCSSVVGAPARTPCPSDYCCGPASSFNPEDNMKICYPPGQPC